MAKHPGWSAHVRRLMPQLEARADGICELCGRPLEYGLRRNHPASPSVDHLVPEHAGGTPLPPLDELRLVHFGCNSRRGNRTRRSPQRVTRDTIVVDDETKSLSENETRRQSDGFDRAGFVAPRLETPRDGSVTGSYAPKASAWMRKYVGVSLRPWQRYALNRILEHRADGELRWRRVILTVSRQSGKTTLAQGLCAWRLCAAQTFGEPQHVLHVANLRATASLSFLPAARRLLELMPDARLERSVGREKLELASGSTWRLGAQTTNAGVGMSISLAFVDEAWRSPRSVVDGAIGPTMLERRSPQLVLVSTAGDSSSRLLLEDRDRAIAQMLEPADARTLLLEWSAPPEAYPDDREAWRQASPHWTKQRLEALEHSYATTSESDWRRQYLNQWVISASAWVSESQWRAAQWVGNLGGSPAGTVAVNDQDGLPGSCGYVSAVTVGGDVYVSGRAFPSRRRLFDELERICRTRRGLNVLYPPSFEPYTRSLAGANLVKVATREQRAGYGPTLGAVADGRLRHDGDDELTRQVLTAVPVTIPDVGTTLSAKRSPGPVFLARAMVWAVGHELAPEQRLRPFVVAG